MFPKLPCGSPLRRILIVACIGVSGAAIAEPQALPMSPTEPRWEATVFGFGWLSSLKGNLDVGPTTVEFDERIGDLVPMLTWVVAGGFEARYDRVLFTLDALGQQIQDTQRAPATSFGLDPLGGAFGGLTASRDASSVSVRSTEVMAEAALGWRALSLPVSDLFPSVPADDARRIRLDLLGGARYWYWRNEVRLDIPPLSIQAANPPPLPSGLRGRLASRIVSRLDLPRSIQIGGSQAVYEDVTSWTDALVGFRLGGDVTETIALVLRADVGGFGFGDSSSFSWQVMPGVQWRFTDHWMLAANWRAIGFSHGKVDDVILYGALLGVGYRF